MGGIARRIKDNLAVTWRWFNYWRRRYVWLRLIIIILVFADPVYGVFRPVIRDLTVIAITGIEAAKRGPYLEARAFQHLEKKRLQTALLARFDEDEDGRLATGESAALEERTGLTPAEVEGSALGVELDPLVEASHEVGLLPRTTTARDFRREALSAALAQRDREHEALWEEAGAELEMPYPTARDYLKWTTWKHGLESFRSTLTYGTGIVPLYFFAGLRAPWPGEIPYWEERRWSGAIGWIVLATIVAICVRRYGKGLELQRRFKEDPELAAAPCPVCGEATNDYGALRQHRFSRACATAAAAGLAVFTLFLVSQPKDYARAAFFEESVMTMVGSLVVAAVLVVPAGVLRWVLWPREIHACHRRPSLLYAGFTIALLLVVGLVSGIAAYGMHTFGYPRRHVVAVAGRRRAEAMARRRDVSTRMRSRDASRARQATTTSRRGRQPSATRAQPRQRRGRGMGAMRGGRSVGARERALQSERMAARRARRAAARETRSAR